MSYCRWSSDNWKSDVYAYENVDGCYTIHVASCRLAHEVPPLLESMDDADAWIASYRAQMAAVDAAERVPIGLPYDGRSFSEETLDDFEARLRELEAAGYRIPAYVYDDIAEEQEENRA